jgi:Protein of unknown function (DUF3108)
MLMFFPNPCGLKPPYAATVLALVACLSPALAPHAHADSVDIKYSVSLSVLPIGAAYLSGKITSDNYKVEAGVKLTGLASLVASARAVVTATGNISANRSVPTTYATTASNSKITRTIRMALNGGTVSALDINPPFDETPDRIPVTEAHKHNIIDPLGAILVPYTGDKINDSVCNRKLPIFDGGARFDISLTFTEMRDVKIKGYEGPVAVCAARYTPVAGHRPDRPATKFMTENRDIEIWLAPVNSTHVAVPYRISLKTMTGTALVEASEFIITH